VADSPLGVLPLYARAGAIVPKIPEDVMTLVPVKESGNTKVHALDDRRVYALIPGADESEITDFEGRRLKRSAGSLTIDGPPAKVTVRWRFGNIKSAKING
jgi:alpha-D-xyloside xylohydrolase